MGISYLNINSVRNKLDSLFEIVGESVDVLTIAETKLDDSFTDVQFLKQGFRKPFRLDINDKSGGYSFMFDRISLKKIIKYNLPPDIQVIPFELNLWKKKWLIYAIYRPPAQNG